MAGQREWGWVTRELGIPNFPQDFPDCQAAADLAKLLAADLVISASVDHAMLESFLAAPLWPKPDISWKALHCSTGVNYFQRVEQVCRRHIHPYFRVV